MKVNRVGFLVAELFCSGVMWGMENPSANVAQVKNLSFNKKLIGFTSLHKLDEGEIRYELEAILGNLVTDQAFVYFIGRFRFPFAKRQDQQDVIDKINPFRLDVPEYKVAMVRIKKDDFEKLFEDDDGNNLEKYHFKNSDLKKILNQWQTVAFDQFHPAWNKDVAEKKKLKIILGNANQALKFVPNDQEFSDFKVHRFILKNKLSDIALHLKEAGFWYRTLDLALAHYNYEGNLYVDLANDSLFKVDDEGNIPSVLLGQPFLLNKNSQELVIPISINKRLVLIDCKTLKPREGEIWRSHNSQPYIIRTITDSAGKNYTLTASGYPNIIITPVHDMQAKVETLAGYYLLDVDAQNNIYVGRPQSIRLKKRTKALISSYGQVKDDLIIEKYSIDDFLKFAQQKSKFFSFAKNKDTQKNLVGTIEKYCFYENCPIPAAFVGQNLYIFGVHSLDQFVNTSNDQVNLQSKLYTFDTGEQKNRRSEAITTDFLYPYLIKYNQTVLTLKDMEFNKLYFDKSNKLTPWSIKNNKVNSVINQLGFGKNTNYNTNAILSYHINLYHTYELFTHELGQVDYGFGLDVRNAMWAWVPFRENSFLIDNYNSLQLVTLPTE